MKEKRHGRSPLGAEILGDGRNMRLKNIDVKIAAESALSADEPIDLRYLDESRELRFGMAKGSLVRPRGFSRE
jgi:hypothetical protein